MYPRKLWLLRRDLLCHCPQGQEAAAGYAPSTIGFDGIRRNVSELRVPHRVIVECAGNWKDGVNACPHAGALQVVDVQTANVLYKYHAIIGFGTPARVVH